MNLLILYGKMPKFYEDLTKEEYQEVVLPLCVLRRFDCLLQPTKQQVLEKAKVVKHDAILNKITGYDFNSTSQFDFQTLLKDPDNIAANLRNYIQGFSANVRIIFERFEFDKQIQKWTNIICCIV